MLKVLLPAAAAVAGFQLAKRLQGERQLRDAWAELASTAACPAGNFDPAMVADLPEPARRFFEFAIAPGTRLKTVVEITMTGELSLGTKQDPNYQPMKARQLLAPPHGLLWRVQTGRGAMRVSGADGMVGTDSWTRFWLLGVAPVVRAGGSIDHLRSSFARVAAEAAFWAPASLLPQAGVQWRAVDADTARASVTHRGMRQEVDLRVSASGEPVWVSTPRWTNANPQKVFRIQPFGGELSDYRTVQGFRVPFCADGGNFFGTPDYFPFYRARVQSIRFL